MACVCCGDSCPCSAYKSWSLTATIYGQSMTVTSSDTSVLDGMCTATNAGQLSSAIQYDPPWPEASKRVGDPCFSEIGRINNFKGGISFDTSLSDCWQFHGRQGCQRSPRSFFDPCLAAGSCTTPSDVSFNRQYYTIPSSGTEPYTFLPGDCIQFVVVRFSTVLYSFGDCGCPFANLDAKVFLLIVNGIERTKWKLFESIPGITYCSSPSFDASFTSSPLP
jgi:hypothetical protein